MLQYMKVICIGEMAGAIALAIGAHNTLACAVAVVVSVFLSKTVLSGKVGQLQDGPEAIDAWNRRANDADRKDC